MELLIGKGFPGDQLEGLGNGMLLPPQQLEEISWVDALIGESP